MTWIRMVKRKHQYLLPITGIATIIVLWSYVATINRSKTRDNVEYSRNFVQKSFANNPKIEKEKLDLFEQSIHLGPKIERVYRIPMEQRKAVKKVLNPDETSSSFASYVDEANQSYPITIRGSYEIDNNNICAGVTYIDALVLVHSATANFERRTNIRFSYGLRDTFLPAEVRVVFLLGFSRDSDEQDMINEENEKYHDIIQGKFKDTYHNLTNKAVMGLRWITENCQNAKYVVKVDDDSIFDMWKFLSNFPRKATGEYIWCNVLRRDKIQRTGKWAVPSSFFKGLSHYPWPFCPGLVVVMRAEVIPKLFKAAFVSPFFWIDDVYVYGILRNRAGGIPLHRFPRGFSTSHAHHYCDPLRECTILAMPVRKEMFHEVWRMMKERNKKKLI